MSRIFRSDAIRPGDRVVVRRQRGEHASDVIGHVVSTEPLVVRPQAVGGFASEAAPIEITEPHIIKRLSPRTVRNSDIRAIETATARAFPGQEHLLIDGWFIRAGAEIAERSNSATPIGHSAGFTAVPMDAICEFYRSRGMDVQLCIPERIGKPAQKLVEASPERWQLGEEIVVMTAQLGSADAGAGAGVGAGAGALPAGLEFRVDDEPDDAWLAMYHYRGQDLPAEAVRDLSRTIDGRIGFARLVQTGAAGAASADAGTTIAVTRATITHSDDGRTWLGYSAVEVGQRWRRQGMGTLLGREVLAWGEREGADAAYLQVRASNEAGIALYTKLGFTEHHRHRYARLG